MDKAMSRRRSLMVFLGMAFLFAAILLCARLLLGRFGLHMAMNAYHGPLADKAFPYLTELANGWVVALVCALMLFHSWRGFLMVGLSLGLSALATQLLKRAVFDQFDRPSMYLEHMPGLRMVQHMELHHHFSFPSGHTTAAFSVCLALAVVAGRRKWAALLGVLAPFLAYTRVYLSQHFTEDILAGAFVACTISTVIYWLLYEGPMAHRQGLERVPIALYRNQ